MKDDLVKNNTWDTKPQIGETYVKGTMIRPTASNFDKNFPTNVREVVSMGLNNKNKIDQILKMDIHDIASKSSVCYLADKDKEL